MGDIEVLARAVIVIQRQILLCRTERAWNTYLPGGHVERGESARAALAREMREELGWAVRVGPFLGGVEHAFMQGGRRVHEVNLLFEAVVPRLSSTRDPVSREAHVAFAWHPLSLKALAAARLEPAPLRRLLSRRHAGGAGAIWASTLARR